MSFLQDPLAPTVFELVQGFPKALTPGILAEDANEEGWGKTMLLDGEAGCSCREEKCVSGRIVAGPLGRRSVGAGGRNMLGEGEPPLFLTGSSLYWGGSSCAIGMIIKCIGMIIKCHCYDYQVPLV